MADNEIPTLRGAIPDTGTDEVSFTEDRVTLHLEEGIELAKSGDRAGAREIFRQVIARYPHAEDAWLWLAWVAESEKKSLDYVREAAAFFPDSARLRDAVRWAERRLNREEEAPDAPETDAATERDDSDTKEVRALPKAPAPRASKLRRPPVSEQYGEKLQQVSADARQIGEQIGQVARDAQENASEALSSVGSWFDRLLAGRPALARGLRAAVVPTVSVIAIVAMSMFVMMGIANARSTPRYAEALVLPTLAANATPTPSFEQRTRDLWVQVDVAYTKADWSSVIDGLEGVREIDPEDEDARERLAEAYHARSLELVEQNELEDAQLLLDQAIRVHAGGEALQQTRRELALYLQGLDAYWVQDWPQAADLLQQVYDMNPKFRDTQVMLGQSYYRFGIERQASEVWDEARDAYEMVMDLIPDMDDAQVRHQQVMDVLIPPKRIEVDISRKVVTLYEEHAPVYVFRICTGRPSAPTMPGRYQILDKLPNAYASKWDLQMPWWLGIYWAGGSENGFHALPILSNGRVLWRGSLGSGCSFGCIVLDTPDAITLYEWAEIGDVVLVDY